MDGPESDRARKRKDGDSNRGGVTEGRDKPAIALTSTQQSALATIE